MRDIFHALDRLARTRPDDAAFREGTEAIGWAALAHRVAALAAALDGAPATVGLAVFGGIDHVIADLAVTLAGRRLVPLPPFFSAEQKAHVLRDAAVGLLIADPGAEGFGLPTLSPRQAGAATLSAYGGGGTRVIYTSGSSGRPRGVVLGDRQIAASLAGLAAAVGPRATDRHLSILPLAQLLEQICGVFLPILAGAEVVFVPEARIALAGGPIDPLAEAMARERPTTSLLVPALLAKWTAWLAARGAAAPDSLRFVAVGGAASAPALLAAAMARGVPVVEGYGLSECCSVVALNSPGAARPGTVGRVLDGVSVTIEDGEIVVAGPTVMEGYLNGPPAPARWRTGDRGRFEGDRLVVEGRRDALLVLPNGRNVSPEWVEARVGADPRVIAAALCLDPEDRLLLLVAARASVAPAEIARACADLPGYVRPAAVAFVDPRGLFFPSGAPDRAAVRRSAATLGAAAEPLPECESEYEPEPLMTRPTVLITGAGSGIGRALAVEAVRRGHTPILAGRRPEPLEETALGLSAEARIVTADIATPEGRARLVAAAGGRLDVLVNNAGTVEVGPLEGQDEAAIARLVETNLIAPILITRALLPALRAARGRVVNVGSMFGDIAYPYFAAYSASKFGLRGFSDALRRELSGEGVAVTYAAPRAARTAAAGAFGHLVEPLGMTLDPPETVALRIWDAIVRGERDAYPRGKERVFVLAQRLFPRLVDASVGAQARHPRTLAALDAAAAE